MVTGIHRHSSCCTGKAAVPAKLLRWQSCYVGKVVDEDLSAHEVSRMHTVCWSELNPNPNSYQNPAAPPLQTHAHAGAWEPSGAVHTAGVHGAAEAERRGDTGPLMCGESAVIRC